MVVNSTKNSIVARELRVARNMISRLRGLIGFRPLDAGQGLLIPHCQGIHTFGMHYCIDAVYLDKQNKIVSLCERIVPNRFGKFSFLACAVLELPTGTIARSRCNLGDFLDFNNSPTEAKAYSK